MSDEQKSLLINFAGMVVGIGGYLVARHYYQKRTTQKAIDQAMGKFVDLKKAANEARTVNAV